MSQVAAVGVVLARRIPFIKIECFIDGSFAKDTRKHRSLPECALDGIEKVRRVRLLDGSGVYQPYSVMTKRSAIRDLIGSILPWVQSQSAQETVRLSTRLYRHCMTFTLIRKIGECI